MYSRQSGVSILSEVSWCWRQSGEDPVNKPIAFKWSFKRLTQTRSCFFFLCNNLKTSETCWRAVELNEQLPSSCTFFAFILSPLMSPVDVCLCFALKREIVLNMRVECMQMTLTCETNVCFKCKARPRRSFERYCPSNVMWCHYGLGYQQSDLQFSNEISHVANYLDYVITCHEKILGIDSQVLCSSLSPLFVCVCVCECVEGEVLCTCVCVDVCVGRWGVECVCGGVDIVCVCGGYVSACVWVYVWVEGDVCMCVCVLMIRLLVSG